MVKVQYQPGYLSYVVIRTRHDEYLTKDGWVKRDPNTQIALDETMFWDSEELKELSTEIAKLGIKPQEASFIEGKLEATEKHLEDMRSLTFDGKARRNTTK